MDANCTNHSNASSCLLFAESQLKILGITQAVVGLVSIVGCSFIFCIMLIFKKYVFRTQRLILYLTIAVFLSSISYIVRGMGYRHINNKAFCSGIAFYSQYTGACILMAVIFLIVELFIHTYILNTDKWRNLEKFYVLVIFVLPVVFDWIPFINDAYGPTKSWCWIRSEDLITCDTFVFGIVLQYILWYVPLYCTIIIGCVMYVMVIVTISKQNKGYTALIEPQRQVEYERSLKEIKQFRWYPVVLSLVNIIPLTARVITDVNPDWNLFTLWVIAAIIQALQGGFLALIFALDPDTRKRLTFSQIKAAFIHNVMNVEDTVEYPIITADSDSAFTITTKSEIKDKE